MFEEVVRKTFENILLKEELKAVGPVHSVVGQQHVKSFEDM